VDLVPLHPKEKRRLGFEMTTSGFGIIKQICLLILTGLAPPGRRNTVAAYKHMYNNSNDIIIKYAR
jgi:hypothetical protein